MAITGRIFLLMDIKIEQLRTTSTVKNLLTRIKG